jgi:hypothetical protein
MGYDLVKCLHSLSIAQPLHDCESNRGASWAASEVSWNLSTYRRPTANERLC